MTSYLTHKRQPIHGRKARTNMPLLIAVAGLIVLVLQMGAWAQEQITVTFWHALGSDHQAMLEQLVDEFNASNPAITVKAEYQGNYGALQQKLIAAVAAGRPPTMSLVYNNWTAAFIEGDHINPISEFANYPSIGLQQDEIADYIPSFIEANTWNGTWMTMPFNKSIYVLYYNADLLDKAGVGVPQTMDELRAAAKAVTEKTGVQGLAVQANVDQFGIFLHAFGGSWIDDQGKSAFNSPEGVAALKFLQDLIMEDRSTYIHDGYLDDEFNQGNTAMFFATVATIPWLSSEHHRWGAAKIPAGQVQAAVVQGTDLAIFNEASRAEQEAAWSFIKWLTSPEVNARWAVATGYLPVRQSAVQTQLYQDYLNSAPEKYSAGIEQLNSAKFDPGLSAWFDARTLITQAVQEALIAGINPQTALDEAAAATDRSLGE